MVSAKLISIITIAIITVNVENANATVDGEQVYYNIFSNYSLNIEYKYSL